ncbi:peptidase domain-containing ABC transporter [Nonomuraea endophytica]|uniref:peptidase domain-containing ABC transporter n=1 Tax=Nonomuraea endophytica TaxID=714136 RepID=UPI0037C8A127
MTLTSAPQRASAPKGGSGRVPLVLQMSNADCGAACLAMLLRYFGDRVSLHEVREVCAAGRDGVSAAAIARAGDTFGLRVRGFRASPEQLPLPLIAHWGADHFVVVEEVTPLYVRVLDPARGRLRLSRAEFADGLGALMLTAEPTAEFRPRKSRMVAFWRTYGAALLRLPGARRLLAQVLAVSVVLQVLGLAVPALTRVVVDDVLGAGVSRLGVLLGAGIAAVVLADALSRYLRGTLLLTAQGRLDGQVLHGVLGHLLRLPLRFFEQRRTGDVVARLGSVVLIREMLTGQVLTSVIDAVLVLTYLIALAWMSPPVALAVAAAVAAQALVLAATTGRVRELMARDIAAQADSQSYLVEVLGAVSMVKAGAQESRVMRRWSQLASRWLTASMLRAHLTTVVEAFSAPLRVLTPLLALSVGTLQVLSGDLTAGGMLAAAWLAAAVMAPLSALISNGQRLQLAGAQLERLADVLQTPPEPPLAETSKRPRLDEPVRVERVSFRYDDYGPMALREVSFTIEPGHRVAIVGSTAAGKTTLAMILLGLYEPTSGSVVYGVPDADVRLLRAQIGAVLQEPVLFSGSLRDNITMGDADVDEAALATALRVACLDDDVARMPLGLDTRVSERGGGLSGGQRQRLAIARAVARHPRLLVLDEATSHLDAQTEAAIAARLRELQCTQVVIAHRLSTIRDSDLIVVLHQGEVAESGRHDELVGRGGRYAALVRAQLGEAATPGGPP